MHGGTTPTLLLPSNKVKGIMRISAWKHHTPTLLPPSNKVKGDFPLVSDRRAGAKVFIVEMVRREKPLPTEGHYT